MHINDPKHRDIQKVLHGRAGMERTRSVLEWFTTREGQKYLSDDIDQRQETEDIGPDLPDSLLDEAGDRVWMKLRADMAKEKRGGAKGRGVASRICRILPYAAAMVLLAISAASVYTLQKGFDLFGTEQMAYMITPRGERAMVVLHDGTVVNMGPDSRLSYPRRFGLNRRSVTLEGDAYFDVKTESGRPFMISAGGMELRVTGTSFSVMAHDKDPIVMVSLDEGRLSVSPAGDKGERVLRPGQVSLFDKSRNSICVVDREHDRMMVSDWKQDVIECNDTRLSDLLVKLERRFDVEFLITDPMIREYTYTISADCRDLPRLLRNLEDISPLKFRRDEGGILVSVR